MIIVNQILLLIFMLFSDLYTISDSTSSDGGMIPSYMSSKDNLLSLQSNKEIMEKYCYVINICKCDPLYMDRKIRDDGLEIFSKKIVGLRFKVLSFQYNDLTSAGLPHVLTILESNEIRHLDLSQNYFTEENAYKFMTEMIKNKYLEELDITFYDLQKDTEDKIINLLRDNPMGGNIHSLHGNSTIIMNWQFISI